MSDTPRTEVEVYKPYSPNGICKPLSLVDADFARQLERELAAAQASNQEIVDYVMGYFPVGMCYSNPLQAMRVVVDRMTQAESERDAALTRVAELERDAGRWQFARTKVSRILNEKTLMMDGLRVEVYYGDPLPFLVNPVDKAALFDAAIDAAMEAK